MTTLKPEITVTHLSGPAGLIPTGIIYMTRTHFVNDWLLFPDAAPDVFTRPAGAEYIVLRIERPSLSDERRFLLRVLRRFGACSGARDMLRCLPMHYSIQDIWEHMENDEYMRWLLGRLEFRTDWRDCDDLRVMFDFWRVLENVINYARREGYRFVAPTSATIDSLFAGMPEYMAYHMGALKWDLKTLLVAEIAPDESGSVPF